MTAVLASAVTSAGLVIVAVIGLIGNRRTKQTQHELRPNGGSSAFDLVTEQFRALGQAMAEQKAEALAYRAERHEDETAWREVLMDLIYNHTHDEHGDVTSGADGIKPVD